MHPSAFVEGGTVHGKLVHHPKVAHIVPHLGHQLLDRPVLGQLHVDLVAVATYEDHVVVPLELEVVRQDHLKGKVLHRQGLGRHGRLSRSDRPARLAPLRSARCSCSCWTRTGPPWLWPACPSPWLTAAITLAQRLARMFTLQATKTVLSMTVQLASFTK